MPNVVSLTFCRDIFRLARDLCRPLSERFQDAVREAFKGGSKASDRRKAATERREVLAQLIGAMNLYARAIDVFESDDDRVALSKHVLRDFGQPIAENIMWLRADANCVQVNEERELHTEYRTELAKQLPQSDAKTLIGLEEVTKFT